MQYFIRDNKSSIYEINFRSASGMLENWETKWKQFKSFERPSLFTYLSFACIFSPIYALIYDFGVLQLHNYYYTEHFYARKNVVLNIAEL